MKPCREKAFITPDFFSLWRTYQIAVKIQIIKFTIDFLLINS